MLLGDSTTGFPLNWVVLLPIVMGFLAVCYMLPTPRRRPLVSLVLALVVGVSGFAVFLFQGLGEDWPFSIEMLLFGVFSLQAFTFALLMLAQRNPARAALFFAVVVLNVCGLFLLLAAPFLMAATIIIYAGAIIVTFLFVIMLSQQSGMTDANDRSREPSLAAAVGFLILGSMLVVLQRAYVTTDADEVIRAAERYSQSDTVDATLKDPNEAKRFLDDVVRVREQFGYAKIEIPTQLNGVQYREADTDPVEELRDSLDLSVPAWPPPSGSEPRINGAGVKKASGQIFYELSYLKALREGRLDASPAVTLSPYGRVGSAQAPTHPAVAGMRQLPAANITAIGRALFTDHLLAVELGGTLLLVATIGAIAIAGNRAEKAAT